MAMFPGRKHEGVFCQYLPWEHGCTPGGGKSPKLCVPSMTGPPWRFLTLRIVQAEPPAICQQQSRLPWHWFFGGFGWGVCSGSEGSLYCLSVSPIWGAAGCPVSSPLLWDPRRVGDFSICSAVCLLVRMQWLLPSYLRAQLKTESPHASFSHTCVTSVWVGAVPCASASGHPIVMALLAENWK